MSINEQFEAVIVSGARTPVARFGGGLKDIPAADLGSITRGRSVRSISHKANDVKSSSGRGNSPIENP